MSEKTENDQTELGQILYDSWKESRLTIAEFAEQLGVPRQTLHDWLYRGVIPGSRYRSMLLQKFPQLLARYPEWNNNQVVRLDLSIPHRPEIPVNEVTLQVNLAFLAKGIPEVNRLLRWFLFEANERERDIVRSKFGEDWKDLVELTRAMVSERAFHTALTDGRLEKWEGKHDD